MKSRSILSVKAGKLHATYVRDLRGVVEREKAAIGILLALDEPTKAMRTEAASARFYKSPWGQHPKLQIVTVGDLLDGKRLDIPPVRQTSVTYKRAPKVLLKAAEQPGIFGDAQTTAGGFQMAKVAAFHTNAPEYLPKHREVYHDKDTCPDGKKIQAKHRESGTGNKKHCLECGKVS